MSTPKPPNPAKLVIGLFMKEKDLLKLVVPKLQERFGAMDIISPWLPFDYTTYYEPEMGTPLFRRLLGFRQLIAQDELSGIKIFTNDIEMRFIRGGRRTVNIDPGYMLHERFVLATGKNFTHRIYIGKSIYADLTLIYQKGAFQTLPWTYPDYADQRMLTFLEKVRAKFAYDTKTGGPQCSTA